MEREGRRGRGHRPWWLVWEEPGGGQDGRQGQTVQGEDIRQAVLGAHRELP